MKSETEKILTHHFHILCSHLMDFQCGKLLPLYLYYSKVKMVKSCCCIKLWVCESIFFIFFQNILILDIRCTIMKLVGSFTNLSVFTPIISIINGMVRRCSLPLSYLILEQIPILGCDTSQVR